MLISHAVYMVHIVRSWFGVRVRGSSRILWTDSWKGFQLQLLIIKTSWLAILAALTLVPIFHEFRGTMESCKKKKRETIFSNLQNGIFKGRFFFIFTCKVGFFSTSIKYVTGGKNRDFFLRPDKSQRSSRINNNIRTILTILTCTMHTHFIIHERGFDAETHGSRPILYIFFTFSPSLSRGHESIIAERACLLGKFVGSVRD